MITIKVIPFGKPCKADVLVMYLGTPVVVRGLKYLFDPLPFIEKDFETTDKKWQNHKAKDVVLYKNIGDRINIKSLDFADFLLVYDSLEDEATGLIFTVLETAKKAAIAQLLFPQ